MRKTIVLIEDNKHLQLVLRDMLLDSGIDLQVEVASNGIWGKEKIRGYVPDLVLLDLLLPGKDGFEILREMRSDKNLKDLPVIVLSNLSSHEDKKEAEKFGVKHFLVKADYSLKQIMAIVKTYL